MSDTRERLDPAVASCLTELARESIRLSFDDAPVPRPPIEHPSLEEPRGAFVTIKDPRGRLRGCIGTVETDQALWETVAHMARAAAFDDPRFAPLEAEELDGVTVEVSVMTTPQPTPHPEDVVPGRHGVIVERGLRRALFLPQVAREQGWDRERLLDQLCLKAGLPARAWQDPDVTLRVFECL